MFHFFFNHLPIDGNLGGSHFLVTINNGPMTIHVQDSRYVYLNPLRLRARFIISWLYDSFKFD